MDLVSVVIPCFNGGKTIEKTIESVKNQTWKNIEIIIVDDGSNDLETLDILSRLTKVKIIKKLNSGLSAARNTGISQAKGNYIYLLDSDDWIEKKAIECLMKIIKTNGDNCYAYNSMQLEGERLEIVINHFNFFEQLFVNKVPYSILLKKELWQHLGGYDENMKYGYEDWEFNLNLGKRGYYGISTYKPLFHYRVSINGMLNSKSIKHHAQIYKQIRTKHKDLYSIKNMYQIWKKWKSIRSNRPLYFYIIWYLTAISAGKLIVNFIIKIYKSKNILIKK